MQGLRNLPAIIHGNRVAIDTVEEIVDYIDSQFPGIRYFEDGSLEKLYLKRPFSCQSQPRPPNLINKLSNSLLQAQAM